MSNPNEKKDQKMASMSRKRMIGNTISYLILILISIIWLFPFFGLIMQSFRSYLTEYGGMVDYIIPKQFSLDNYRFLLSGETNYLKWYGNTVIIAIVVADGYHSQRELRALAHAVQGQRAADAVLADSRHVPGLFDHDLYVFPSQAVRTDTVRRSAGSDPCVCRELRHGLLRL